VKGELKMAQQTEGAIKLEGDTLVGPLRQSRNTLEADASIHNPEVATKLGFRGGTVAGSIHMDLFPPLFLEAFGQRWFEHGSLSLYFINATLDREPVRASMKVPPIGASDAQVDVSIDRDDGMRVAEGTAAVGDPGVPTALSKRVASRDADGLRILAALDDGDVMAESGVSYSQRAQDDWLTVITERLPCYQGSSPWGGAVVPPAGMVSVLYNDPVAALRDKIGRAIGLFGAIELRNVNGPVLVETPYRVRGHVLALGQSPKTEYFWFNSELDDESGRRVAEMTMLLRFMKASSPLYDE
jgi:hypothetical protein